MVAALGKLLSYLRRAPLPVQIAAVVMAGVVGIFAAYYKLASPKSEAKPIKGDTKPQTSVTAQNQTNVSVIFKGTTPIGTYDPSNGHEDSQRTIKGDNPSKEDGGAQLIAGSWHTRHSGQDDPHWQFIYPGDKKDTYVKFRYFGHSDNCLDIVRSERGRATETWVFDPLPPVQLHQDNTTLASRARLTSNAAQKDDVPSSVLRLATLLTPTAEAMAHGGDRQEHGPEQSIPIQANGPQFCINPHPGQFAWYWGVPNGCWQPMFRRFADGCTHYQLFNHCTNSWDQQVYWTFCTAPHSN